MDLSVRRLIAIFICSSVLPGLGQNRHPPRTPAQSYLAEYLHACNFHDEAALTRFATAHLLQEDLKRTPAAEWARLTIGTCNYFGGFDLWKVESESANRLQVLIETRAIEGWFRLELRLTSTPPFKIISIHYFQQPFPQNAERHGLSDEQILAELARYMDKLVSRNRFSGVVLVARDGKPIFHRAYGMADWQTHQPNTLDSVFTLASMSKMFTAIAVAQLVEQGKISYQDTVGKFFPNYPNKKVRDRVTVAELLDHTSGFGDYFVGSAGTMNNRGRSATADLLLFENRPLLFEPGTRWGYSNAGFILAGAIVEKVSGETWFEYLRKHLFVPAGMFNSDPNETGRIPAAMAIPYVRASGGAQDTFARAVLALGSPAGSSYSTARDLLRFAIALRSNTLVSRQTFEELIAPHSSFTTPRGTHYGYGFETWANQHGRRVVGHGGGTAGVDTEFDLYVEQGYTVIVLSNYDESITGGSPKTVASKLRAMILAK